MYIVEDVNNQTKNNIGTSDMVYLNPECKGDISNCALDPADWSRITLNPKLTFLEYVVTTYFNLTSPESANVDLNAQDNPIWAGTFRYVRIEFCKTQSGYNQPIPNIGFQAGNMTEPYYFPLAECGVTSPECYIDVKVTNIRNDQSPVEMRCTIVDKSN